jgi:hypothetical protein
MCNLVYCIHFFFVSFIYRSTEREIPLPEEEIVQFNNDDVVLDFCKKKFNFYLF